MRRIRKRSGKALDRNERDYIERRIASGASVAEVASELGRHRATVYRELKRGVYRKASRGRNGLVTYARQYSAQVGEDRYRKSVSRRGRKRAVVVDQRARRAMRLVLEMVGKRLYSPYAACAKLASRGDVPPFSPRMVYRCVERGDFGADPSILPREGRQRRRARARRKPVPPGRRGIDERPEGAEGRAELGHWEGDLVVGPKKTSAALLTLVERKTRMPIVRLLPDRTSASVVAAVDDIEREHAGVWDVAFKTVTWDNGTEFADFEGIERSCLPWRSGEERWLCFYAHPNCPHERGSNENLNGLIRRLLPKGTDFARLSADDVAKVEAWAAEYPRRSLGGRSALEEFRAAVLAEESAAPAR